MPQKKLDSGFSFVWHDTAGPLKERAPQVLDMLRALPKVDVELGSIVSTGETINGRRIQKFVPVADLDDAKTRTFRPSGYPDVALRHYDPRDPGTPDKDDRDHHRD